MLRPIGGFDCCRNCERRAAGVQKRGPRKPNRMKDRRERERSERNAW